MGTKQDRKLTNITVHVALKMIQNRSTYAISLHLKLSITLSFL